MGIIGTMEDCVTHANAFDGNLSYELEAFIKDRYKGEVVSVEFSEDFDDEGDAFITITVGVVGSAASFVRSKPIGLLRVLRAKLMEAHVNAFPTLNFVSTEASA
jgi:hypothetical protein